MKKIVSWLSLAVVAMLLVAGASARPDEGDRRLMERLERMEQQVQRLSAMQDRSPGRIGRPDGPRGPLCPPAMQASRPMPPSGPACPVTPRHMQKIGCAVRTLIFLAIVVNIILAVWVYSDTRKQSESRGIFIVLVLLAGLPAAILYALIRLGDRVGQKPS
ncbi:MAG: hypothetical protein FJ395_13205 [Verrucomicrobia bacterium]|nr:hypothetical protein [Verrucomicrobiota bacterium]